MITLDFNALPITSKCRLLDIGCGSGRHTAAAYDAGSGHVVGADSNFADLMGARDRMRLHEAWHHRGRWTLIGADINHLPFEDEHFDIVVCSEVLEHVQDYLKATAECIRVLKGDGHLVVSVPRRWPEVICWALSRQYRQTEGGHVRIFIQHRLIARMQDLGLCHRRTHYAHSLHAPYWWLKCLLGPSHDYLWPIYQYHRFLTWDLMHTPPVTRLLDRCLNPIMGKSVVLYFRKPS